MANAKYFEGWGGGLQDRLFIGDIRHDNTQGSDHFVIDLYRVFGGSVFAYVSGDGFVYEDGEVVGGQIHRIAFVTNFGDKSRTLVVDDLDVSASVITDSAGPRYGAVDEFARLFFDGDDVFRGSAQGEAIHIGKGADKVVAGGGNDVIFAVGGGDTIYGAGESPQDVGEIFLDPDVWLDGVFETAVGDVLSYASASGGVVVDLASGTALIGDARATTLIDIEGAFGGQEADTLRGDAADNTFLGDLGADLIDGRDGFDVVSFHYDESGSVRVNLANGVATDGSGVSDRLIDIEGAIGNYGDDTLIGNDADNLLGGGYYGRDVLIGGAGADRFVMTAEAGRDVIRDFASGEDKLLFSFKDLGADPDSGFDLVVGRRPRADGDMQTFLFDAESHVLRFDVDGDRSLDPIVVALLEGASSLTIDDFVLV